MLQFFLFNVHVRRTMYEECLPMAHASHLFLPAPKSSFCEVALANWQYYWALTLENRAHVPNLRASLSCYLRICMQFKFFVTLCLAFSRQCQKPGSTNVHSNKAAIGGKALEPQQHHWTQQYNSKKQRTAQEVQSALKSQDGNRTIAVCREHWVPSFLIMIHFAS